MITLYGFGKIFPAGIGETRDIRVEWALEEVGLPYRVHPIDQPAGELQSPEFSRISPFNQAPVLEDEGFILSESSAIFLYLAEKTGKLIPGDFQGRMRVTQWCFAAVNTVEPTIFQIQLIALGLEPDLSKREGLVKLMHRWLQGLERRLEGREWIATEDFTVADLSLACVLRMARKTDLVKEYPRLQAYYHRAFSRPAWERARETYARRLGVEVAAIGR